MTAPPVRPRLFHITHVDNIALIAEDGLLSDSIMVEKGGPPTSIGMSGVKADRLAMPLKCHPGDFVGDYVPFNFCPRSYMLLIIYYANHPSLSYRGGQEPIVHLEADMRKVIAWAESEGRRWAFSLSNARAAYTEFRKDVAQLGEVDWEAVDSLALGEARVKHGKQAEFLVHEHVPWSLVRRIGVHSKKIKAQVEDALTGVEHQPSVAVRGDWYI